jgi:hypothetical protein
MRSANREARRTERSTRRSSERALRDQQDRARQRLSQVRQQRDDVDMRQHNAIITGVLPRIQGAVDSWCRKRVKMQMSMSESHFSAMTNFDDIFITIPEDQVSMDFLGDLRGLAYHEAGHIRKTLPYPRLVELAMNGTTGLTVVTGQAFQDLAGVPSKLLHNAWNILEDQRMETAMVVDSKNLGRYYNVIVLTHVIQSLNDHIYAWLAAREHIDADVVEAAREEMVTVHGEAETERIENLVWQYVETTDAVIMWDAVVQLAQWLQANNAPAFQTDVHTFEGIEWTVEPGDQGILDESATIRIPMPGASGAEGTEGEGGDEGDEEGDSDKGEPAKGAGTQAGKSFGQRVQEAIERATEARNADKTLTNDMRSFNEALHDTRNHTPLPRVPTTYVNTNSGDMAEAVRTNRSLRLLMESARAEHAPSWQTGQRVGVLDVMRYKTRQPGDMEFFRNIAEGGDLRLPNLAVSVLLDGSGSMSSYVTALGKAAYAIKSACDACEVPCTVSVFDTEAHLLWDAEDRPVNIPDAFCPLGGTNPTNALECIDMQMHDKARHLVIIMTDGAWAGWQHKSLDEYQYPNRDVVVLFWNTRPTGIQGLNNVAHARIDSLMEIPQMVRRFLTQSM